jgi:capsular exopolysaccharide synthesis family protein
MDGSNDQGQGPAGVVVSERLAYYLKVLRRRWRVIALVPGVAAVVTLAFGLQAQKEYDATAKLVVNPANQINALLNPSAATPSADPERDLNTEVSRIKTVPLAGAVRRKLGLEESPEALLAQVTTSLEGTTNIVAITVRDPDPTQAAALANAFATRYVAARERDARSAFERAATRARQQLESLTPTEQSLAQGRELRSRLGELEIGSTLQTGNAEVIQPATQPTTPASPRVFFDTVLAAFLGLILGVVAAGLLELLDRRVRDEDDVKLITRLPTLASIPVRRRATSSRQLALDRDQTEAYRSLATNLRFFKLGGKIKTLLITSPGPLDGKTSVTLSLARALAEYGQEVTAVECDFRRPRFAAYLGLSQTRGLSSILAGMVPWSEEAVEVDANWRAGTRARGRSVRFSVLPSGPPSPSPQALLSSSQMHEFLVELCISKDVVLLDAPPMGTLTDAVPLLPWVDCVALVVRPEHTTRDALKKACSVLTQLDAAPVLGTVLNGVPRSPLGEYSATADSSPAASGFRSASQDGRAGGRPSESAPTSQA